MKTTELPGVEFEGSLGHFYDMEEVPLEAMIEGICEIYEELFRRNYKEWFILESVKITMQRRKEVKSESIKSDIYTQNME